jgi:hypothetical protein
VFAGGYQGALERVLLYYAYQIDGLNSADVQRLGWKCMKWSTAERDCMDWRRYENCDSGPGGRCNFNQFVRNMGYGYEGSRNIVPGSDPNARTLDIDRAAANYYHEVVTNTNHHKVMNYAPNRVMKFTTLEYQPFLDELGDLVQHTANSKKTKTNAWMFDEFTKTVQKINEARAGDHGPYAIREAKAKLGAQWVVTRNVGLNPALNPDFADVAWQESAKEVWSEVNWVDTQNKMEKAGIKDAAQKITTARNAIYGPTVAREHLEVMERFREIERKVTSCR